MVWPCVARGFVDLAACGLASMYPASDWSGLGSGPSWISAHEGPQMLDERARFRGTPGMGRHKGVDRQRRAAPRGERLDERAALEIVADQQFGREADPYPQEDRRAQSLRAVRPEIARDVDCCARSSGAFEYPAPRRVPSR